MLRLLVLLLVVANLTFFAWSQGHLDGLVGVRAQGDREPERLREQVRPETLQLLPAAPAAPAASAASSSAAPLAVVATANNVASAAATPTSPTSCLEAGPYAASQIAAVEGVLQATLPAGSWSSPKTEGPGVWVVFMGKYPNREALQKKADELKRLRIAYEELRQPPAELEGGLVLGRYDSRAAADRALGDLAQRGVRSARVATLSPPTVMHSLRIERADATLQARLSGLRADALQGKTFTPCVRS